MLVQLYFRKIYFKTFDIEIYTLKWGSFGYLKMDFNEILIL